MKDLIVLCADKDTQFLLTGLFPRLPVSSGLRPFTYDIFPHQQRDAGVLNEAHHFLRSFIKLYENALVIWDLEGCGQEKSGRAEVERRMEENLCRNGWEQDRVCAVAIAPELENWIWGTNETHLKSAFGWKGDTALKAWVEEQGLWSADTPKPNRPKEAMDLALRQSGKSWSASIHKQIAANASYKHCTDGAFLKMIQALAGWFPGVPGG